MLVYKGDFPDGAESHLHTDENALHYSGFRLGRVATAKGRVSEDPNERRELLRQGWMAR